MSKKNNPAMPPALLWVDLEMTGLEPEVDAIIEVGVIITDWSYEEHDTFRAVVFQPPEKVSEMDEWNQHHHGKSGLLDSIPDGEPIKHVEQKLIELLDKHFPDKQDIILAGNSIHQDRRFIRKYLPRLEARLHYRMLDVSAWKVVMAEKYNVVFKKKELHRAIEDIRGSIEEMKLYEASFNLESQP